MKTTVFLTLLLVSIIRLSAQFYTIKPAARETFRITSNVTRDSISKQADTIRQSPLPKQITSGETIEGFSLPLASPIVINSSFGYRTDPFTRKRRFHNGLDLQSDSTPVLSMFGGKVKKTGYDRKGLGKFVVLTHGDFEVTYGHLSSVFVSEKDLVKAGMPLGISGSTGRSTGDHLHLSLKISGKKANPLPLLLYIQRRLLNNQEIMK